VRTIEKPWGRETILEANAKYVVKKLTMYAGKRCSRQFHNVKTETIHVLKGDLIIEIDGQAEFYFEGSTITILAGTIHRMSAPVGSYPVEYLECSTPELDDVVRLEDDWGR